MQLQVKKLNYKRTGGRNKTFAIKDVSFTLDSGYMMCLLGNNGEGKSTLLKLIYGMLRKESGEILWGNEKVNELEFQKEIVFLGEDAGFLETYSLQDNMTVMKFLYPNLDLAQWKSYLEEFGFTSSDFGHPYMEFSTGQKRQFQLAFAFARKPKLLILDEISANLDPVFRVKMMEYLQKMVAEEETAIIYATHIISDVEDLADYIGILNDGELILFDDRETLRERYEKGITPKNSELYLNAIFGDREEE